MKAKAQGSGRGLLPMEEEGHKQRTPESGLSVALFRSGLASISIRRGIRAHRHRTDQTHRTTEPPNPDLGV